MELVGLCRDAHCFILFLCNWFRNCQPPRATGPAPLHYHFWNINLTFLKGYHCRSSMTFTSRIHKVFILTPKYSGINFHVPHLDLLMHSCSLSFSIEHLQKYAGIQKDTLITLLNLSKINLMCPYWTTPYYVRFQSWTYEVNLAESKSAGVSLCKMKSCSWRPIWTWM